MDSEDLSSQSFQTDTLGMFAASQETGPHRSLINEADSRSFYNKHNTSNTPSHSQRAALGVLLELEAQVVLAWLTILRYSKPGEFQPETLSSHQVAALIELKDCPHSLVGVWLQDAHSLAAREAQKALQEDSSHQATCFSALNDMYNNITDTTTRNSTLSGTSTSCYGYSTGYSTPMSSYAPTSSYPNSINEIPSDGPRSSLLSSAGHPHGCPICQKDGAFGTCDGWKRHMKEHETLYPCNTCATSGKVRSYSRKINLLRHLATHGFSKSSSSKLADEWRKTHDKKYFGCGFCVFLCDSLTEQLSHIDSEHFRNFSSISEWDTNKVIRGLSMQPDLSPLLQNLLGQPFAISENLSWHPSIVHELQLRLQESNETAEVLARITVDQIDWDSTARNNNELTSALSFGYTCQDASALTSSHHQIGTVNNNDRLWTDLASPGQLTSTQDLQPHPHSMPPSAPNHDNLNVVNQQLTPINGRIDGAHGNFKDYQPMDSGIQSSARSNNRHTQGAAHSSLPIWKNRTPSNVDQRLGESVSNTNETSVNGVWPSHHFAAPTNITTTPRPTDLSYQQPMSKVPRTAALGQGLPPTPCSSEQIVARVLSLDARSKKQRSSKKLGNWGAPDIDFEHVQYLMREHDGSRSVRRQR